MQTRFLLGVLALAWSPLGAAPPLPQAEEEAPLPTEEEMRDAFSTALGTNIATRLKADGVDINLANFVAAFSAVVEGKEALMDEATLQETFQSFESFTSRKAAAANAAYLQENKDKEGITTTKSGLQYEVLTEGTGDQPTPTDQVTVHYTGTLIDGTVFDSSVERGEPASFPLNQVIAGWTEGVGLMKIGAKYRFHIPYFLAYGEEGRPPRIPPYATLVFEIELLSIGASE
ncbi:MAG: FKBP-type peptidyl-prolyl cis-trans isomerase [Verrucomicrobiota bacterium]